MCCNLNSSLKFTNLSADKEEYWIHWIRYKILPIACNFKLTCNFCYNLAANTFKKKFLAEVEK